MKRSARTICALVFLAASVLSISPAAAGPSALLEGGAEYILTPMDVNSDGLVVGYGKPVGSSYYFAWAWREGQPMEIIGQIGGSGYIAPWWYVYDVNDSGQAVGTHRWWNDARERMDSAGFLWTEEEGVVLLDLPEGMDQCNAKAINNAGQVVGQCWDSYAATLTGGTAFLWNPDGEIVSLGHLGRPPSEPVDINESGQVLGKSYREGIYAPSCFFWSPDTGLVDLGDLEGSYCIPKDLNDHGQVVAVGLRDGWGQGTIWDLDNGMRYMFEGPTSWSFYPEAINNAGQVIGNLYDPSYSTDAAIWSDGGGMQYLNHPDEVMKAVDINQAGQVLLENISGKKPQLWSPLQGLTPLHSPGKLIYDPVVLGEGGHAVGSFTKSGKKKRKNWSRNDPDEYGVILWKVKQ